MFSVEKSEQQADLIKAISIPIVLLDVEYCREMSEQIIAQGNRQDSMIILNPSYLLIKNEILREQGKALSLLCDYVDSLKRVEKLKLDLALEKDHTAQVLKLFI